MRQALKCQEANQTITVLVLYQNHIGSVGAVALAERAKGVACDVCLLTCARDMLLLLSRTELDDRRTRSFQAQESSNLCRDMPLHRGR